jgi:hypothetical protein
MKFAVFIKIPQHFPTNKLIGLGLDFLKSGLPKSPNN